MERESELAPEPSTAVDASKSPVLWSRATAEEIVSVISQDAEAGVLAVVEAMELIDRVWQRAAAVPDGGPTNKTSR